MSRRSRSAGWVLGSLVVVIVAACSSSGYKSVSSPTTASAAAAGPTTTAAGPTVRIATVPGVGSVLVDASGLTLYHNTKESGSTVVCTGGCATAWPPLLATGSDVTPGPGVTGTLDTLTRPDGGTQVRFNGMPLYHFAGDTAPGTAKGQGVAGVWFAVPASGAAASTATTPTIAPAAAAAVTTARPAVTAAPTTAPRAPATTAPHTTSPPATSAPTTAPPTTSPPTTMPCAYPPCY